MFACVCVERERERERERAPMREKEKEREREGAYGVKETYEYKMYIWGLLPWQSSG